MTCTKIIIIINPIPFCFEGSPSVSEVMSRCGESLVHRNVCVVLGEQVVGHLQPLSAVMLQCCCFFVRIVEESFCKRLFSLLQESVATNTSLNEVSEGTTTSFRAPMFEMATCNCNCRRTDFFSLYYPCIFLVFWVLIWHIFILQIQIRVRLLGYSLSPLSSVV